MHFSALVSLTALSCLALVAAVPPLANPDIVTQAQTSEREISGITKHHKHHKSPCSGKCGDKTCDIKDGCSCADKFVSEFFGLEDCYPLNSVQQLCFRPKPTTAPGDE
ncbi:hypothetical protein DFH06DRAFT_1418874 [Mycena polygramma]|nr:hypothetical protein DFH06DRAFT_1418874 [Mycena polygramma]